MIKKKLTEEEKATRTKRWDELYGKATQALYGTMLLAGIVYVAARTGTRDALEKDRQEFYRKQEAERSSRTKQRLK